MAEARQLLPGFNHNVRHAGKLFHVQTEASGPATPNIVTHLFLGGNVVATKKTTYAEHLGAADVAVRVRKLMEAQHKEMLRQLVHGTFDAVAAERAAAARSYSPGELATDDGDPGPTDGAEVAASEAASAPAVAEPASADRSVAPKRPNPPFDGWGPPVLPRVQRTPLSVAPPPASAEPPADRRLDELVLTYLAEDLGAKRER